MEQDDRKLFIETVFSRMAYASTELAHVLAMDIDKHPQAFRGRAKDASKALYEAIALISQAQE